MMAYKKNISILFAGWLVTLLIVNLLSHAVEAICPNLIFKCILLGPQAWPVILYFFNPSFKASIPKLFLNWPFIIFLLLFFLSSGLSLFHSPLPLVSLVYILSIVLLLVLSFSFSASMSNEEMRQGFVLYGLVGSMILVIYALLYWRPFHAFFRHFEYGVLNHNIFGVICASIVMACLLSRNIWIKTIASLATSGMLFLTKSRGAIIGLLLGLIIWRLLVKKTVLTSFSSRASILILFLFTAMLFFYHTDIYNFIINYFALNDNYRGITGGFSGRMELWQNTWDLFKKNPLTGVGYQMSPIIMHHQSHNIYLKILLETGIIGSIPIFYFFFNALFNYFKSNKDVFVSWAIGFIFANLFTGCFENYLLSTSNTASVITLALLVRGFANHQKRVS